MNNYFLVGVTEEMEDFIYLLELSLPRLVECIHLLSFSFFWTHHSIVILIYMFDFNFAAFSRDQWINISIQVNHICVRQHRKLIQVQKQWPKLKDLKYGGWKMNSMNLHSSSSISFINCKIKLKYRATIWHRDIFMKKFDRKPHEFWWSHRILFTKITIFFYSRFSFIIFFIQNG